MDTQTFWKEIADYAPNGIIIKDEAGQILYCNDKARGFLQYGKNSEGRLPKWLCVHGRKKRYVVSRSEGDIRVNWTRISYGETECTLLYLEDVSQLRKNRDELTICKWGFDAITDLGLMVLDITGKVILYNLPSALNDGIRQEDALGHNIREIFSHKTTSTQLEVLRTGEPVIDREVIYTSKSGKQNYCFGSTYPIKKNGQLFGAISVIRFNDSVKALLSRTLELQRELAEVKSQKSNGTHYCFKDIICHSPTMLMTIDMAKKAARSSAPVLIYGETGTGKELIAQSIHNAGPNCNKPFVAINCAAIPENLLESTLFGTTKGAFTGAQSMPGLFEQAGQGTLFLDELNSMPMGLQAKLLRVIQEKVVRRVGAQLECPVSCRIISSCNQPPLECVRQETLRDDLYYRLSVICIEIPTLRRRSDDVLLLANFYVQKYAKIYGTGSIKMTPQFQRVLLEHNWPGNVRELQHVIESALVQLDIGEDLDIQHLQPYLRNQHLRCRKPTASLALSDSEENLEDLHGQLAAYERRVILAALDKCDWNISQAARVVGYSRSNLQYRMKKLKILEDDE